MFTNYLYMHFVEYRKLFHIKVGLQIDILCNVHIFFTVLRAVCIK
jgi:hypothetical protein